MKQNPYLGNQLNIGGTLNVLESCVHNKINNIIFASTFYVYDCVKDLDSVGEKTKLDILSSDFSALLRLCVNL